jgi:hypothetical protein
MSHIIEKEETLLACARRFHRRGFNENFEVDERGFHSAGVEKFYKPEEITIVEFKHFESDSDSKDESVLYAIKTTDGKKGIFSDVFGPHADPAVAKFMKEVKMIITGK